MKRTYAFNSLNGDRRYSADDIALDKALFVTDGVVVNGGSTLTTQLKVTSVSGLQVQVANGSAFIKGRTITFEGEADGSEKVTLPAADATLDRIDRIVLELNLGSDVRDIVLKSIQGTPALTPVAPLLTRTDTVHQISLAQIRVVANSAVVGTITDERSNSAVCGVANVTIGITPPTGNDATTIMLSSAQATLYGVNNVDAALQKAYPLATNQKLSTTAATLYGLTSPNDNVDKALQAAYPLAVSQKLGTTAANLFGLTGINANAEQALINLYKRAQYSNLTLFKINTCDATSGVAQVGYNISITGANAPTTTQYVTNSNGYIYLLLPYGSYTLKFLDTIIGYDTTDIVFSSTAGESYKDVAAIFTRSAVKKYTMDTTKAYKKASYITSIDAFLVGGGGTGGGAGAVSNWDGGGGGGGYTKTQLGINVSAYTEFTPTIGAGGSGWVVAGGQTSFLGYTANGGSSGSDANGGAAWGGAGGSGGGGSHTTTSAGGVGGSDGSNGATGMAAGGAGQGTTTREFGEAGATLYSGGGGGAEGGAGGAGGGGNAANSNGVAGGSATFYGGGGGGAQGGSAGSRNGGDGYKGCVVIRWA